MTVQTFNVTGYDSGESEAIVFDPTPTSGTSQSTSKMDERVSLHPLSGEDALRGLLMTREIEENPGQAERLDSAREHAREGAVRWVEDEGNLSTDSE